VAVATPAASAATPTRSAPLRDSGIAWQTYQDDNDIGDATSPIGRP
jgi:hypothetical protein